MKRIHTFTPWERPLAELLRERLEKEGIACIVRNGTLSAAMGEIPFTECFPQLWIIDEEVYPRANMLLKAWLATDETSGPWVCDKCGEALEGQFESCWRCGHPRPESSED